LCASQHAISQALQLTIFQRPVAMGFFNTPWGLLMMHPAFAYFQLFKCLILLSVIPAEAGIQSLSVIPAEAGIQSYDV